MIIDILTHHSYWTFFCLGLLLLVIELLGTDGYALWAGVAALIVGIIAWCFPTITYRWLWSLFAVLTIMVAFLWWKWSKKYRKLSAKANTLNQGNRYLIGRHSILTKAITDGELGRIKIGDSSWLAKSEIPLTAGTELAEGARVEVVAVQDTVLIVRAL